MLWLLTQHSNSTCSQQTSLDAAQIMCYAICIFGTISLLSMDFHSSTIDSTLTHFGRDSKRNWNENPKCTQQILVLQKITQKYARNGAPGRNGLIAHFLVLIKNYSIWLFCRLCRPQLTNERKNFILRQQFRAARIPLPSEKCHSKFRLPEDFICVLNVIIRKYHLNSHRRPKYQIFIAVVSCVPVFVLLRAEMRQKIADQFIIHRLLCKHFLWRWIIAARFLEATTCYHWANRARKSWCMCVCFFLWASIGQTSSTFRLNGVNLETMHSIHRLQAFKVLVLDWIARWCSNWCHRCHSHYNRIFNEYFAVAFVFKPQIKLSR